MADGKKQGLFSSIETRDDALKMIRSASTGFFTVAALQALIGVFLMPAILIDAVILTVLALILRKWNSRVAAVLLLLMASAEAIVTVLNRIGVMAEGGKNIFLAFIMLVLAIRAAEASFKLHGSLAEESVSLPERPKVGSPR